jgi:hypothetical protein
MAGDPARAALEPNVVCGAIAQVVMQQSSDPRVHHIFPAHANAEDE